MRKGAPGALRHRAPPYFVRSVSYALFRRLFASSAQTDVVRTLGRRLAMTFLASAFGLVRKP